MFGTSSSTSLIPWALIPITTTHFIAGLASTLVTTTQEMPLNIYPIFVGPPTRGKSQAIKECAVSPMTAVVTETDSSSPVIQKCMSSRLIKTIADNKKGFFLSGEIYNVLFKLLKSDKENATGDVQVLCQLLETLRKRTAEGRGRQKLIVWRAWQPDSWAIWRISGLRLPSSCRSQRENKLFEVVRKTWVFLYFCLYLNFYIRIFRLQPKLVRN